MGQPNDSRIVNDVFMLERLEKLISGLSQQTKNIILNCSDTVHIVPVTDIIRCKSDGNYTSIYLINGQKFTVARTLKVFESLLRNYRFYRIHQSHLINLSYLRSYIKKSKIIVLYDNTHLPLAARKHDRFLKDIRELLT